MEQKGALLYCECGRRIWSEVWDLDKSLGTLVFFDDDERSETYTERVIRCPGCGKQLVEGIFATRKN